MKRPLPFVLAGATLLASACVTTTPSELIDARAEYQTASQGSTPDLAPIPLHEASKDLARAEREYAAHPGSKEVADLAYIAQRRTQLAESQARMEQARRQRAQAEQALRDQQQRQQELQARGELDRQRFSQAERDRQEQQDALARSEADLRARQEQLAGEQQAREEAERARDEAQRAREEAQAARQQEQRGREEALARAQAAEAKAQEALDSIKKVAPVREEARGTVITLSGSLLFASGQSELLPAARSRLDQLAEALKETDQKLRIEGHTDSLGSAPYNEDLSYRRAEAVRAYLEDRGLAPERIDVVGYGKSRPIADNRTPDGRATNRRVEIVLRRPPAGTTTGVGGSGGSAPQPAPPK